ncbi:MAG: iron ABC transporter permease [Chitinophagaceae bacterium]|nr:MAG: iron ABC transporter permease [Chitinophagaceae bacterium]
MLCGIAFGAVPVSVSDMASSLQNYFSGQQPANIYEAVFLQLRLPRVLLCAVTGAVLSVSGVLMQGLFRNPIVEPGLVGTSSGAALGASIIFVLSANLDPTIKSYLGPLLLPIAAFLGALAATSVVYSLAKSSGKVSILSLLLVGIAVNAVCLSGTGFMSYIARDPQARSITFWNLGTFSGSSWTQVGIVGGVAFLVFFLTIRSAKALNALLLGEEEAAYLGVDTEKLKRRVMLLNTAMVAVATAFVGVIAFMGLIVPHVVRILIGSDNRRLLPASAVLGATLLLLADLAARLFLVPAEMPIGIITSLVGAPVFILLLKRFNLLQPKGGYRA